VTLGWSSSTSVPPDDSDFIFVGDPSPVALSAAHQLTGFASVSASVQSGQTLMLFSLCYRREGGEVTLFDSTGTANRAALTTSYDTHATSASAVPGAAGVYDVGFCASQPDGVLPIAVRDVTGWVMVTVAPQHCGNALLNAGEACDDGDNASGDGCAASCDVEIGYACSGQPSLCVSTCGDGVVNVGEAATTATPVPATAARQAAPWKPDTPAPASRASARQPAATESSSHGSNATIAASSAATAAPRVARLKADGCAPTILRRRAARRSSRLAQRDSGL
jgi:cysteine-rich repeat protein